MTTKPGKINAANGEIEVVQTTLVLESEGESLTDYHVTQKMKKMKRVRVTREGNETRGTMNGTWRVNGLMAGEKLQVVVQVIEAFELAFCPYSYSVVILNGFQTNLNGYIYLCILTHLFPSVLREGGDDFELSENHTTLFPGRRGRDTNLASGQERRSVFDRLDRFDQGPRRSRPMGRSQMPGNNRMVEMEVEVNPQDVPRGKRYFLVCESKGKIIKYNGIPRRTSTVGIHLPQL